MKKTICSIALMLCYFVSFSQEITQKVQLNFSNLSQKLLQSKTEKTLGVGQLTNSETIISLPLTNGRSANFKMVEYFIVPENAKTDIKTYYGEKEGDPSVTCRVTLTKEKVMASIIENGQTIIVERVPGVLLSDEYQVYVSPDYEHDCKVHSSIEKKGRISGEKSILNYSYGATLKTYRIALVITSEFYSARGNSDPLVNNEIVAIVNNLNGIYEKEVAVRFTLISPNNPVSTNFFYRHAGVTSTLIGDLFNIQNEVYLRFGSSNLDIGHCLHSSGGGVAYLNGVCNNGLKAAALSGSTTSSSVLLFAHELGHQFNANHTFNGNGSGNCGPSNREDATALEPGSGNTIMSYAGICSPSSYNIVGGKVPYFHTKSLEEMSSYIITGGGSSCGTASATGNIAPIVSAGTAYTIPKGTPFKLIGSGSDGNADNLTYTWEQFNVAAVSDTGKLGHQANSLGGNAVDSPTAPLFRSVQSTSSFRYFPALTYVLNNANNPTDNVGEDLPNVSRVMNFRLTGRDNRTGGGGAHCSAVAVTVDATKGPLSVTSPNTAVSLAAGAAHTITWTVNSTNALSANVKILLSIDGGGSFPYILNASTPNDGSQSITIPSNVPASPTARIIVASNNSSTAEFFDASDVNFTITSTCLVANSFVCTEIPVSALAGNSDLNLGMTNSVGNKVIGNSKSFSTTGAGTFPVINFTNNTFSTCQNSAWGSDKAVLVPFQVSASGNYSISLNYQGFAVYSIFTSSSTFNCSTFVNGNSHGAISWSLSRSISLNSCTTYYALLYNLNSSNTSITFNMSGPGDFIELQNIPSGFSYTYAAINQTSNLITDVSATSNFTGTAAGTYKIYGLMFANGFNTSTLLGKTMTEAYELGACMLFSNNSKPVTIIPNPCAKTLTLVNPTDNISSGNVTKTAASGVGGKIIATNLVTGNGTRATYTARAIELNEGFLAEQGTVFKAEVGGCN
ncbi:MAG TPA: M12 family metallo-peptidase [Leadbetterella sp.]|nr:M12 family metallo-peptidase [Leadbetterella sp.]